MARDDVSALTDGLVGITTDNMLNAKDITLFMDGRCIIRESLLYGKHRLQHFIRNSNEGGYLIECLAMLGNDKAEGITCVACNVSDRDEHIPVMTQVSDDVFRDLCTGHHPDKVRMLLCF